MAEVRDDGSLTLSLCRVRTLLPCQTRVVFTSHYLTFPLGHNNEHIWTPQPTVDARGGPNFLHRPEQSIHLRIEFLVRLIEPRLPRDVYSGIWPAERVDCLGQRHRIVEIGDNVRT